MKLSITVNGKNEILTDKQYLAAGGEAAVYKNSVDTMVYKVYHDPARALNMLNKIKELQVIKYPAVLTPTHVIYETASGKPIGYSMRFLKDTTALCKFFTKAFKVSNKVSPDQIKELIKNIQLAVAEIHKQQCLVVDLNELNVLVSKDLTSPNIIDTDSFQTPSYPATAIMLSVKDPKAGNHFTELSDWFSFGILAFQTYINIHPFKGKHPNYDLNEWEKRMKDGVSVFDKAVTLPPICNPLSSIPASHLKWFEGVFHRGDRSIPPLPDAVAPQQVPPQITISKASNKFLTSRLQDYDSPIEFITTHFGVNWVTTSKAVYAGTKVLCHKTDKAKIKLCASTKGEPITISPVHGELQFHQPKTGDFIGKTTSYGSHCFVKHNAVYTTINGKLCETTFLGVGDKTIPRVVDLDNVSEYSSKLYDGLVVQDLLGEIFLTIPYEQGRSKTIKVPELKGYRILDARSEKHITIVQGEKAGEYWRFIFTFEKACSSYAFRLTKMTNYDTLNFTVKSNGVTILVSDLDEVEVFANGKVMKYKDPPFDSTNWLFNANDSVYFVNGNSVYNVKIV